MKAIFVLEGIDGTGKSTQAKMLENRLLNEGKTYAPNGVIRLYEPTDSEYGKKIREIMSIKTERLSFAEELDLFIKDRKYNVKNNIKPAMKQGKVIILDRYYFSTAAYQGSLGKISYKEIIKINEKFAPRPSILFIFVMDIEVALDRIYKDAGRTSTTYMEKKENLLRVQDVFLKIHESKDYNSVLIDASKSIKEIQEQIWLSCKTFLEAQSK
ncbi:MAG: dTMP kinase [Promethearchaeota archaeon]